MSLSRMFDAPAGPSAPRPTGPVDVGWLLTEPDAGVVFLPPERVRSAEMNRRHAKSASRCPAPTSRCTAPGAARAAGMPPRTSRRARWRW